MRMLGYFVVDFIHTLLNVSEDKIVILNDFPQNLLELGGFCQRIEFCLDTPLVRDPMVAVQAAFRRSRGEVVVSEVLLIPLTRHRKYSENVLSSGAEAKWSIV